MCISDELLQDIGNRKFFHYSGRPRRGASTIVREKWRPNINVCRVTAPCRSRKSAILPVESLVTEMAHLYLWIPNALLPYGLTVMKQWGFNYKTNLVWYKIRKDGGPDRRGVGFLLPQCDRSDFIRRPAVKMPEREKPAGDRRILSSRARENTAANPMNSTS